MGIIRFDDYKGRVMWHVFTLSNRADMPAVLDYIKAEYGGYPDGLGNLLFDNEEQKMWFLLRWS
jgi:hypothetical protein